MAFAPASPTTASRQSARGTAQATADATCWVGGLILAAWARYEFVLSGAQARAALGVAAIAITLQILVGHPLHLYRGRYTFGTFDEVRAVSSAVATATVVAFTVNLTAPDRFVPGSTPITGGALALVGMLGIRYVRRLQRERTMRPDTSSALPVLIVGAGNAGSGLVRSMLRDPVGKYIPVGLIDDDAAKRHLRVCGVPVLGNRSELADIISRTGVTTVIFSLPSATPATVRETRQLAEACGAVFKVLPSVTKLLDRPITVSDVRDVDVTDLLGRGQIQTDMQAIAGYLAGKRVLVTGAGGSIGSELCRQLHRFRPAELLMLDRDESALHAVQLSINGRAMLDDSSTILADIRDTRRIDAIFAEHRPQVVFHAAALKHQPLLEQYPAEAVKTNVWGTISVLEAATAHDVDVFVNISTDKAADPCSVLGYSKRVAERLTAAYAQHASGRYLSVRFGNVLGSRGSVLTAFAAQIAAGGPLTVTDPLVTRYFMTVHEAVQLVIQAGAVGRPGEALVLDMGEPVRIDDVARQMISLAGEHLDIVYTGLRPGEKLHECLFGAGERDERPAHPLISHVAVPPLDPAVARVTTVTSCREAVIAELVGLCTAESTVSVGNAPLLTDSRDHTDGQGGLLLRSGPSYRA